MLSNILFVKAKNTQTFFCILLIYFTLTIGLTKHNFTIFFLSQIFQLIRFQLNLMNLADIETIQNDFLNKFSLSSFLTVAQKLWSRLNINEIRSKSELIHTKIFHPHTLLKISGLKILLKIN